MNAPTKILLTLLTLGSIGGAGYYLLDGQGRHSISLGDDGSFIDPIEGEDDPSSGLESSREEGDAEADGTGRQSLEIELDQKISGSGPTAMARLQVEGRVLTKDGRPVKNAKVDVFARKSFDFRRTMRRGNWREAMNSSEARNWMSRRGDYKPKKIGDGLLTDDEGRFTMDAETFTSAEVELTVQHEIYAPVVVNREWKEEEGKLVLDKIEVEAGGKIIGTVLSKSGSPVTKAKIGFDQRSRGRRGRGGWGRRSSSDRLKKLLGNLETNELGQFLIPNAPPGEFSISVDHQDYIPNRSGNLKLEPGATTNTGVLYLERGAVLSGVVRNQKGQPVVKAKVSATVSQAFVRKELEALLKARNLGSIDNVWRNDKARNDPQVSYLLGLMQGGRGGRGMMGMRGGSRANNEVETDKEGQYTLARLAHAPLEVRVRHGEYLDENKKGIDPDQTPKLDILVEKRLNLSGVVLNASTGEGLENFGIRARRIQAQDLPENIRQTLGLTVPDNQGRGNRGRDGGTRRNNRGNRDGGSNRNGSNRNGSNRNGSNRNGSNRNQPAKGGQKSKRTPRKMTPEQMRRQAERQARQVAAKQKRQLEQDRRDAQRKARTLERDRQKLRSFGNSGIPFRGNSEITKHAKGGFSLERLNPGLYVLDIHAPGFRKIAAGPYRLEKGAPLPSIQIRLQRGRIIQGVVATRRGKAIPGAEVELFIPPTAQAQANANQNNFMAGLFRRGQNNGTRLDRVRTDGEGKFQIDGQGNGIYRLVIRAEGYASQTQKALQVSGRDVTGIKIKLARAGKIFGKVHNLPEEERITVTINGDNGTRRNVNVDANTGEYSEGDLDPGRYLVRVRKGNNFMGGVMSALAQPGGVQPNVVLGEGDERRFDLNAGAEELGKIEGMIYLNGAPVAGLSIQLEPIEGQGGLDKKALQGMGRMRRFLGRMFQARTNKEGKFTLNNLPPANYDLSIKKRVKGGEKVIHKEVARITPGGPQHLNYSLILGRLKLTAVDQTGKKVGRARILLALSAEAGGLQPKEWRNLASYQRVDLRGGKLDLRDLKTGEYQYYLTGRQLTPRRDRLFIAAPPSTSNIKIQVQKKLPKKKAAPKGPSTNVAAGAKK